ncbi:DUF4222 domain-containing protein [Phytobacter diazotrophicus]|uniref:DUF4222 domain-containing protein n=1 Tax=Phytobacter diazotrophicus TaxID=395631 RepID=UPI002935E331|nr:DUF4222 domain-containing protein [Phytobacter diazotrophicus]MDV2876089.1 DUF4222 domain-containing protein [Phytobacter diazotrophicus]
MTEKLAPLKTNHSLQKKLRGKKAVGNLPFAPSDTKPLDLEYSDPRGVVVHVIGWNRDKQQGYFTRQNYPHECMQPVWKFQQYFTKAPEAQNA